MTSKIRIAIDCMGGDFGPRVPVLAALKASLLYPNIDFTLVGDSAQIESLLDSGQIKPIAPGRKSFLVVHAADVVEMSDKPSSALRHKQQSSMRIAIDLLKNNAVDAVVSSGNTGALLAMGCYVLKTLPGVDRPAICSSIPSADSHLYLLDLGANVDCKARHLHQFAVMGSALSSVIDNIDSPRVAALNIGSEDSKGNEQLKLACELLATDPRLNFVGSIEGSDLFSAPAEVVVCDGFVGNVALKVSEGAASYIASVAQQELQKSTWPQKLVAALSKPLLKRIYQKLDPQRYNGATFLGLQGVLVKSHGNSTVESFVQAIFQAKKEAESDMLSLISKYIDAN